MIDLFTMNDDQVIDWILDQAGLKANAKMEFDRGTGRLTKISVEEAQVEVEMDNAGMMVVRQKGQEVLRRQAWTFLEQ